MTVNRTQIEGNQVEPNTFLDVSNNLSDISSQQTALNNITNVSNATNEYVLTKDTSSGNAIFKASSNGSLEARHYVGTTGQPAFQNSWVNYGSPYPLAAFYKDNQGIVHLEGMIKYGTMNAVIFTLPADYAPTQALHFVVNSNNTFGAVNIYTFGGVSAMIGSNVWIVLDGITFRP
jgi:hypothetical protein